MSAPPVQTLWIGPELKPLHQACLNSFLAKGHSVHLYCYQKVSGVPSGVIIKNGEDILPQNSIFAYQKGPGRGSFSAFSNVFRYALLFSRGGLWVDTDVFCLQPFLTEAHSYLFASETLSTEKERILASCIIQTPAGSPLMKYCLDESLATNHAALEWGEIGPQLLTRAVRKFQLEQFVQPSWKFCAIGWDEPEILWDPASPWKPPRRALGLHLNHEMLRRANKDFTLEIVSKLQKWIEHP